MGSPKNIYVILNPDGEPVAATPFGESAQSFVVENKGMRFVKVPRLKGASAVSMNKREDAISERMVDSAISAKLGGVPLSVFAKSRGVRYDELRDRVNSKWGYSKPWPNMKPKESEGPGGWKNHKGIFEKEN